MSWFVYYDAGHCNYGDHRCEIEPYATKEEAERRMVELTKELSYDSNFDIRLYEGRLVTQKK